MNPQVFREYDIRGIMDKDLVEDLVTDIGRAAGTYIRRRGGRTAAVGRDCRLSSPQLNRWLVDGLLSTGVDVKDLGIVPTPLLYFGLFKAGVDGGVQITGSHNPPEYNGFKVCLGHEALYGAQIQELRKLVEARDFEKGQGSLSSANVVDPYVKYVVENIKPGDRRLKVVLDAGNGTGGVVAVPILRRLGFDVVELFCDMDGRFPNHHPDPTVVRNMQPLIRTVAEEKADFGIAYDGDADRIGIVDETGDIIWGDKLLILFARNILKEKPGAKVIGEVKCSQLLFDDVAKHGGKPIMWKTGHSLIKAKMKEEGADIAGEMSGHIFFANRYLGYDDAIYSSLRLAEIVSKDSRPVSEMLADLPAIHTTPEIRVDCPEDLKFGVVEELRAYFSKRHEVVGIDGARIDYKDGWGLVRASNTQPALVTRFEATSPERLAAIKSEVETKIAEVLKARQSGG